MLIGVKKEQEIAAQLSSGAGKGRSYWAVVRKQFRKNRMAVWALRLLYVLLFVALTGDFIANEKPLYCKLEGETHFPVFRSYLVSIGLADWEAKFFQTPWHEHDYETAVWPLIPFSASTLDISNANYAAPGAVMRAGDYSFTHRLGTDELGRDVLAGLVSGTRIAMLVGILAMAIATLIGGILGALGGYFGDDRFKVSRASLWLNILGLPLAYFYGFSSRSFALQEEALFTALPISLGIVLGVFALLNLLAIALKRLPGLGKEVCVPLDLIVMRLIEIFNSIPALLLILSIVAIIEEKSIFYIMAIIGLIRWTGIARFLRAELLRVRSLEYIEAAQALGYSEWRTLFRHAMPNALTPVLITVAFGIASAILLEAFLSFLGIGVPPDQVTWGSMLNSSRSKASAWWLAVFPGFAIFLTVTIFNLLGEGLTDALDPRRKN
jgi:peptide/nickel transport system permease protein